MKISEEVIERIKQENDIVDIISESVRLKRSGRNFFGLCPFHNDKNPSFSVSQEKQIYKCFSCGEAGNVVTFVMKQKNLQYVEALKYLAEKANIPLDLKEGRVNSLVNRKKDILHKVNVETGRFFFKNLTENNVAKEYFSNRGIKNSTIRKFGLGYAKNEWSSLIYYLRKKGFKEETLLEAGLVSKSPKGKVYDRFRNRVMFPVFDIKGNVIGFGGRVLDDSKPKYLNSPETLVFQKGYNLYGLNFAIKEKMEDRYFIIVEGYMDCIALNQYGITNVVASLGTALTMHQARLLKRYADKVIISYDADVAGQTATLRGLEILRAAGLDVRVLIIPQGKDPDEFIRSNGKEAFLKLINSAISLISYKLKRAKEGINFKENSSLIKYGKRVAEILADLNPVEKDVYIKEISEDTGIKEQSIYDLISDIKTKKDETFMNGKEEFGTELYLEPAYVKAERSLIKLMFNDKYYVEIIKSISSEELVLNSHKKIFNLIIAAKDSNAKNIKAYIEAGCDDIESSKELTKINELNLLEVNDIERLSKECIRKVKLFKLNEKLEGLKKEQKELEQKGKIQESIEIAIELTKLNEQIKKERG